MGKPSNPQISGCVAQQIPSSLGKNNSRIQIDDGLVHLRGIGMKVQTLGGVTSLTATVGEPNTIPQAEAAAIATPGVTKVSNKLIPASMFERD